MHCPWRYHVLWWNSEGFLLLQWRSVCSGPFLLSHFSGWSEQRGDKREASVLCDAKSSSCKSSHCLVLQCSSWNNSLPVPNDIRACFYLKMLEAFSIQGWKYSQSQYLTLLFWKHPNLQWHFCLLNTSMWKLKSGERSVNTMHGAPCVFRWS